MRRCKLFGTFAPCVIAAPVYADNAAMNRSIGLVERPGIAPSAFIAYALRRAFWMMAVGVAALAGGGALFAVPHNAAANVVPGAVVLVGVMIFYFGWALRRTCTTAEGLLTTVPRRLSLSTTQSTTAGRYGRTLNVAGALADGPTVIARFPIAWATFGTAILTDAPVQAYGPLTKRSVFVVVSDRGTALGRVRTT